VSKNLYNEANYLVRQAYFNQKKLYQTYQFREELANSSNFQQLPLDTAKKVLWYVDKAWKSFFAANADWKDRSEKYLSQPRIPKYKFKNGQFQITFAKSQVTFRNGTMVLPQNTGVYVKPRLTSPSSLLGVRVIPKGVGYILEILYDKYVPSAPKYPPRHIIGIDIGLTNLKTMVNNIGETPIVIKGGVVKSINQYYNKERARIQSIYDHQGMKTGKTMHKLTNKRNKKITDYFHKASRKIVDYCILNDIGTIVIGYNPDWKQNCQFGKRNNQNFVTIPFYKLRQQLNYKAEEQGILVIKQEESHSSKCSFLDNESIKHNDKYQGNWLSRGLFKFKKGIIINADVNGGYNILKKAFLNAFTADRIEDVGVHPTRWRLGTATS
jgi:putative transposase